jgi:hypothetical protein
MRTRAYKSPMTLEEEEEEDDPRMGGQWQKTPR